MSYLKKWGKRLCVFTLAGVALISLAACGGEDSATGKAAENADIPEYTYVPEYIQIEGMEDMSLYNARIIGDSIYCLSYDWNDETMTSYQTLHEYSITDRTELDSYVICENDSDSSASKSVSLFGMMSDGSVLTVEYIYDYSNMGSYSIDYVLCKYDSDNNETAQVDIGEASGEDMSMYYLSSLSLDGQDRIYLFADGIIFLFDSDLNYKGKLDTGSYFYSTGTGRDGRVYASMYDTTVQGFVLKEIDFDSKSVTATYSNFSADGGSSLVKGIDGDFLINDGSSVYEYSLETEASTELFTWLDSDIFGNYVQQMSACDDGRLLVCINDWSTGDNEIALLTRTKTSELEQKTQITIGAVYDTQDMLASAVAFNRQSDKYHVNINYYMDSTDYSEDSISNAHTALNNDLITDACPDIVDISSINIDSLAAKGVFEDLNLYLEESSTLDKSDYLENIIEGATYDGALVYIPKTFNIQTVVGRASDVGEERGWGIDDIIELSAENPDAELFEGITKQSMLYYLMEYNQKTFVDYESGVCSFDSDEFKKILEFVSSLPDEYSYSGDDDSLPTRLKNGNVLLDTVYLTELQDIQIYEAMYDAPVTYIGYPTADGSVGCMLGTSGGYAIAAKSDNKEGAWEFIEFCLNRDDEIFSWGFPSNKADMQEMIDDALNVSYLTDENGELVLDSEGNPIAEGGVSSIGYDDWEYTYHNSTQEEVDLLLDIISEATASSNADDKILSIITEEAAAYFEGQKSVDDVAGVIQSRVQIYINENQ
ncbi:MAG: extracellular solute-binding protein [Lachnospiraceae bacterium]|nr:extracellular solute-binding protein [Lachnospiraceae bacterium]